MTSRHARLGLALLLSLIVTHAQGPSSARNAPAAQAPPVRPGPSGRAPDPPRVIAEGHLVAYPGAAVVVGTDLPGTIVRLPVEENRRVRRGELIAELRADDLRAELEEARARVVEEETHITLYEREAVWHEDLLSAGVVSAQARDRSVRDRDAALARRQTALATLSRVRAVLAKTRIVAPLSGTVVARHVEPGETVQAGRALVTIVDLGRLRVEAEVDEFDSARVSVAAEVVVRAEGYGDRGWRGSVEEIPHVVVDRRLRPTDPGRPTDTRVLLVKIALAEPTPLKLGQRVQAEIR